MNRDKAFEKILINLPNFASTWGDHLIDSSGETQGIAEDFGVFSSYAYSEMQKKNNQESIAVIANLIEDFIQVGDSDVNHGATMGFLEGIVNTVLKKEPEGWEIFIQNSGSKTKEFLRELDKFWGTKTPKI